MVCHCQGVSDRDIRAAVDWMRAADPATIITPGKVYRALGKRADCGGCLPLFLETMARNPNLGVPGIPGSIPGTAPSTPPRLERRQARDRA